VTTTGVSDLRLGPESASVFEAIVGTVRQPLLVLDRDFTVRLANRAFRVFFGESAAEVDGRHLYEIGDGLWDLPALRTLMDAVVSEGRVFEDYPLEVTRPAAGVRSLMINARLLSVNGEELILLAVEDVTERDGLERLVSERTAELEAFNYSVSHDLRAPLRALDGFSRALTEDCADQLSAEGNRFLRLIRDNAKQMGALIDGLLAFSRLGRQGMSRVPVDVRRIVNTVLEDLAPDLEGRDVQISLGELPVCDADPVLLRQVYANLLGNAVKFTRSVECARIEVGSRTENGERVWFVVDNGVGFDMAYAANLFETFHRLHRADQYEGTGIGLALVRLIVQRHGGEIRADAAVGAGATFSFTIPIEETA
jgi:PAS domain S-box-containing protein